MKTVQPKIDNLLIGSLGFIPLISSAGHFSSPRLTTKFLILAAWRIAAPHIILGSPESMSKHLAISSSVECLQLSSTSWTALRETPSHCLASASWASHTEKKFLQAGRCFTLCLKQFHKHKLRVLVCKHYAEPEPWQWLYSERSHHVCEHPLQLLFCLGLCHSWYRSLCDLGQCTHFAHIIEFLHWLWCIPDHIRLI